MEQNARLIIPLWGKAYADKLTSMTLPALLAPGNLPAILDALGAAGTRASFFIQGRWASSNPAMARRIAEEGHTIGNHSKSHAPMDMLTDAVIAASLSEAEQMIEQACGVNPRPWFRCPYGHGQDNDQDGRQDGAERDGNLFHGNLLRL